MAQLPLLNEEASDHAVSGCLAKVQVKPLVEGTPMPSAPVLAAADPVTHPIHTRRLFAKVLDEKPTALDVAEEPPLPLPPNLSCLSAFAIWKSFLDQNFYEGN